MASLGEFWSTLDGPVHPEDEKHFRVRPETAAPFQTGFVPSAFFGDVVNAPVILCYGNGGSEDEQEFYRSPSLQSALLNHIRNPGPIDPTRFFDYFANQFFTPLIADGRAALVSAVAYRSVNMSSLSQGNTRDIPSVRVARTWIGEICRQAAEGSRLVVFHRWGLWGVSPTDDSGPNVIFSTSPASKHLPMSIRDHIRRYLAR
jgi:hypothetical protein